MLTISSNFDSGNIQVVSQERPDAIRLRIEKDAGPDGFFQWFHFRVVGHAGEALRMVIENAGEASYLKGWEGYRACASYDRETWFRIDTDYEDGALILSHTPACDSIYYAYFAPYGRERHHDLIARCQTDARVSASVLGRSVDGEDIDLLTIGRPAPEKRVLWTIARQHPGETQAEYWMEGFLTRLLDRDDPIARTILQSAVLHAVPNMNPDGSRRGHLRTNAAGINLNRAWADPSAETSPEVFHVAAKMAETGVDFVLDVHGDEGLPYVFIAGADGIPDVEKRQIHLRERFEEAYERANPDFQRMHGYPKAPPGRANLTMAATQLAHRYQCLAMTLEMPFKDNANAPDPDYGWSPARCRKMGAAALDAIAAVLGGLR
ncbi:MAG: M14-type cytosolic carboxypeptidase [Alphaproteobacteria bacterium]|nr:M14-type cytosolic carboxypeptidase [Alphaproteobacteria bacterium]